MELFRKISNWYFSKKVLPYWAILLTDSVIVFVASLFTYWIANKTQFTYDHRHAVIYIGLLYAAFYWVGARLFRTYSGVLRYSSFIDLMKIAYANAVAALLAICAYFVFRHLGWDSMAAMTPGYIILAFVSSSALMLAMRVSVKLVFDASNSNAQATPVLIYGALLGGVGLAKYIRSQSPAQFELKGFISHEPKIQNKKLMDVPVYSPEANLPTIIKKDKIAAVLVSPLRTEEFRHNQKMQDILIGAGCAIYFVSGAQEANIKNGELTGVELGQVQLKEVSVEDLLPRQEIHVNLKSVREQLTGKRVLVTGSAGSIGMEIVRQVASFAPAQMLLLDQAETPQHDVRLMMAKDFPDVPCEVIVTSICHTHRMDRIFATFRPDYVFHAAAYKHVPMMEDNPSEAVLNNIYGTKVLADLSVKYGVKKFVMISTDKAVNPTNVMGCSKRICEIYVQSLDRKLKLEALGNRKQRLLVNRTEQPDYTQFVTTRFGNVLGSNGSVIPLFRQQIKNGGPVTVTDENIVRFFMLIPEACKLVLEAGTKGNGGEIFVFDMGEPVKISDLAKRMIALSGAKGVQIQYTGLREGEKLYEEVLNELEGTKPTFHEKIRIAQVREYDYEEVNRDIDELCEIAKQFDNMETVRKMKQMVPEYKSNNSIYEQLDA